MLKNIAVYVAGDVGIFFPGLVALKSIRKHNVSNPFDYFMCFDGRDLTGQMDALLRKNDIKFVDTAALLPYGSVTGLTTMKEQRWPNHVFYNWLFPEWLEGQGYDQALKVDYDLLCVGRYYLPDLMPDLQAISALTFDIDLIGEGVKPEVLSVLGMDPVDGRAVVPYFNAGVVGINIIPYTKAGTYKAFREVYQAIQADGAAVTNAEQAALAIVAHREKMVIKHIPVAYNQRITLLPEIDREGRPILKNIHYLTQNKPWKTPDYRYLSNYARNGRTSVYIYRDIWHENARNIEGYSDYVAAHSPTAEERLAMYTTVLRAYHNN